MNAKTIIRKAKDRENPYAQIARSAAQDDRLSWKATGLLCYILSLPDDWQIRLSDLAKRKQDGIAATKSALKELAAAGYIGKKSYRDEKGRFVKHECIIHEAPITNNCPLSINPTSGLMDATNNTLYKETDKNDFDPFEFTTQIEQEERRKEMFQNKTLVHTYNPNNPDIFRPALM